MKLILTVGPVLLFSFFLQAADVAAHGGELFEMGSDPRNTAMSQAVVSNAVGPGAVFVNPSLLAKYSTRDLLLTHRDIFSGQAAAQTLALPVYWNDRYWFTFGLINRSVDEIPDTRQAWLFDDPQGPQLDYDQVTYFSQNEVGFILSAATVFRERHFVGMNVKPLFISLGSYSATGLGIDLGYFQKLDQRMSMGVLIQDATSSFINWSTGTTEIILPRIVFGGSYNRGSLLFSTDLSMRFGEENEGSGLNLAGQTLDAAIGLEWRLMREIHFQAGASTVETFTAGFQLRRDWLDFSYAFQTAPAGSALDPTHQFGVAIHLDKLKNLNRIIEP